MVLPIMRRVAVPSSLPGGWRCARRCASAVLGRVPILPAWPGVVRVGLPPACRCDTWPVTRSAPTVPGSSCPTSQAPRQAQGRRAGTVTRRTDAPPGPSLLQGFEKLGFLENVRRALRNCCALCATSTSGYDASYAAISGSNAAGRAIGNGADATCRCVRRAIPVSPHTVDGGCRRRRPCRWRSRCASSEPMGLPSLARR